MNEPVTIDAREAVLERLGAQHDHYVLVERRAWKRGEKAEAEGAHIVAIRLLRAYAAERDDPPPPFRP